MAYFLKTVREFTPCKPTFRHIHKSHVHVPTCIKRAAQGLDYRYPKSDIQYSDAPTIHRHPNSQTSHRQFPLGLSDQLIGRTNEKCRTTGLSGKQVVTKIGKSFYMLKLISLENWITYLCLRDHSHVSLFSRAYKAYGRCR